MMLFYKLWMLEYSAQSLTTWQGLRLHERYTQTQTKMLNRTHLLQRFNLVNRYSGHFRIRKNPIYHCRDWMELYLPKRRSHTNIHIHAHTHTKLYPYGRWRVWQENTELLKLPPWIALGLLKQFTKLFVGIPSKWKSCFSDVANVCVCVCVLCFPSKLPQTQMEWAQLLEAQQRYHDAELQKWREIIKSSVVLLDQVLGHKEAHFRITSELWYDEKMLTTPRECAAFVMNRHCICN